jgi:hypothetical protein
MILAKKRKIKNADDCLISVFYFIHPNGRVAKSVISAREANSQPARE